jgi:anti-sigma regulatory factor (Ser/Thr protein kinase)
MQLSEDDQQKMVIAVNELVGNVVRHGGGTGRLHLWHNSFWVFCRVDDYGAGFAGKVPDEGAERVASNSLAGRGLWMVHNLVARCEVRTDAGGTTITLSMARSR